MLTSRTLQDAVHPGIVARPLGSFTTKADYHYQTLRCNVDLLKVIQIGITLFNAEGETPPAHPSESSASNGSTYPNTLVPCPCTWQFNFRFSLTNDMYAQDSIETLQRAGVDFALHEKNGIDPLEFGSYLTTSGLVLMEDVRWISFHAGYDLGYLLQIMTCRALPDEEVDYRELLELFFPSVYDLKYLIRTAHRSQAVNDSPLSPRAAQIVSNVSGKADISDVGGEVGVKRVGPKDQAGSNSMLAGKVFFELLRAIFQGHIDDESYMGKVWGLDDIGSPASSATTAAFAATHGQGGGSNGNGTSSYANGGAPSTPNAGHVGLADTPTRGPSNMGSLTPGGGGGAFGAFQFGK